MGMATAVEVALPPRLREALPVLADEEVPQKSRSRPFRENVPRQRQRERQHRSAQPRQSQPDGAPPARQGEPQAQREARHHDRHRALGEQPDGQPDEKAPSIDSGGTGVVQRVPKRHHRQRHAEGHEHVGSHRAGGQEAEHRRQQYQRCRHRRGCPWRRLVRPAPKQPGGQEREDQGREACRERTNAEHRHRGRTGPKRQRRLTPKRHTVVPPRTDPVGRLQHLSAHLTVAGLGAVDQRIGP